MFSVIYVIQTSLIKICAYTKFKNKKRTNQIYGKKVNIENQTALDMSTKGNPVVA